jgi:hypothetical protein
LDEIAHYEEQGTVEFEGAFRSFADYVDVCMSNPEIRKYLEWIREKKPDAYSRLELLHKKMKAHDAARRLDRAS